MAVDEAARLLFVSTRYVLRLLETSELLRVHDASGDVFDIDPTSSNIYICRGWKQRGGGISVRKTKANDYWKQLGGQLDSVSVPR